MKKRLLIASVIGIVLASTTAFASPCGSPRNCANQDCQIPDNRSERMADLLGLSADQQQKIAAIRAEQRALVAPLREEQVANRQQLEAAIKAQPFNESAVRTLATAQAANRTELTVARARMQSQIHAVFTSEQRILAEKLRPLLHEGKGPRGRHGAAQGGAL